MDSTPPHRPGSPSAPVRIEPVPDRSSREPRGAGTSRPLLHLPAYVPYGTPARQRDAVRGALLELLLACLHSLQQYERRHDVLVTSNDPTIVEVATRLRALTGSQWNLQLVTAEETAATFRVEDGKLTDPACARFIYPKFYPVLRRAAPWLVHLDVDTLIQAELDFGPHAAAAVSLVDAHQLADGPRWAPTVPQAEFFGLATGSLSRWTWLDAGVVSVRGPGLDLCQAGVEHYLANLDRAVELGVTGRADELMLNAFAVRERDAFGAQADYNDNFLGYYLARVPAWRRSARVIHFHALKPNVFRYSGGGRLTLDCPHPALADCVSLDFCFAALHWCRHLHAAATPLGVELPTMRQMPLPLVERDIDRVAELLDLRASANVA